MPRKATGKHEAQRLRQQRYRQRLAVRAEPEVSAIDTALSVAVAEMLTLIDGRDPKPSIKDLINRSLTAGIASLKDKGFSGPASERLLKRRISALRLGISGRKKR